MAHALENVHGMYFLIFWKILNVFIVLNCSFWSIDIDQLELSAARCTDPRGKFAEFAGVTMHITTFKA